MSDTTPYRETTPGDLITADLFNDVQVQTREEIARKVAEAVAGVKEVDRARDAARLGGRTPDEWARDIVERALQAIPRLTNYRVVYKRLQPGEPAIIEHKLRAYPLVDVYQLGDFPVVSSADDMQTVEQVSWYLYHRTEMKIRRPKDGGTGSPLITIEESRGPVFKHAFQSMLDLYEVKYTEQSALGDVVNEFWKKLFSDPNDPFDETTYASSPWFDRCCGDRRTVESLRRGGEWNDLYLKVVPRKTINAGDLLPLPVRVEHYDLQTVGLTWTRDSAAPVRYREAIKAVGDGLRDGLDRDGGTSDVEAGAEAPDAEDPEELRVMVLLKV